MILKIETQSNLTKSNLFSSTSGLSDLRTLGNEGERKRERRKGGISKDKRGRRKKEREEEIESE